MTMYIRDDDMIYRKHEREIDPLQVYSSINIFNDNISSTYDENDYLQR